MKARINERVNVAFVVPPTKSIRVFATKGKRTESLYFTNSRSAYKACFKFKARGYTHVTMINL